MGHAAGRGLWSFRGLRWPGVVAVCSCSVRAWRPIVCERAAYVYQGREAYHMRPPPYHMREAYHMRPPLSDERGLSYETPPIIRERPII